ncbi:uncharacterized protein Z518_07804 [Rhinocladiella mackenziei CBS 650.93]|uniref:SnoaL-like domain-containing protein n=1 Tax=Rhinocladiella mackenziei CBS 650.93 TaxID=1442369 RepID=A0A0D2J5E7_9EURO|nr:uncharacterized protein Z518_07804 [Rhinocladiella mackenziei CBS 650.93]KIX04250.1 hypothetical protein Z518_07804 [Rhinocladiella mackenziei CBS 650.93]
MAPTRSQLLQVATAVVDGFSKWTIEDVMAPRSQNCIHHMLPASLEKPPFSNDELSVWLEQIMAVVPNGFNMMYDKDACVVDKVTRKVVLYAKATAETKAGPFHNEYVFTITVNEEGTLADRVEEWMDSKLSLDILARLANLTN